MPKGGYGNSPNADPGQGPDGVFKNDSQLDAFHRLRVSQQLTQASILHIFDSQDQLWTQSSSLGATLAHDPDSSAIVASVTTTSGSHYSRRTREWYTYRAGQSMLRKMTFIMNEAKENLVQRIGWYNDVDGVFLELSSSALRIVKRNGSPDDNVADIIEQADWNVDTLQANTTTSGKILDITKAQLLVIDCQWQGVGVTRIGFDIGETVHWAHKFSTANSTADSTFGSPRMPMSFEIFNSNPTDSNSSMKVICLDASREGQTDRIGFPNIADTGVANPGFTGVLQSFITVRLKAGFEHASLVPQEVHIVNTSANPLRWVLLHGTTDVPLGGIPSGSSGWVTREGNNAISEYNLDISGTVIGGKVIDVGYVPRANAGRGISAFQSITPQIKVTSDYTGSVDYLTLAVQGANGSDTGNFHGHIGYIEEV
jgi:hypothetical protein